MKCEPIPLYNPKVCVSYTWGISPHQPIQGSRTGAVFTLAQSSFPEMEGLNLKLSSVRKEKQSFNYKYFKQCAVLHFFFSFFFVSFTLWPDKHFLSLGLLGLCLTSLFAGNSQTRFSEPSLHPSLPTQLFQNF